MKKLYQALILLLTLTSYNLDASGFYITNNYDAIATNLQFYNSSGQIIGYTTTTLEYTDFLEIPADILSAIEYLSCDYLNTIFYFDVYNDQNTTFFGAGSLTNNTTNTLYVNYTLPIFTGEANVTPLSIAPNQVLPIPTGTGSIKIATSYNNAYSSGTYVINATNTSDSTQYSINYNGSVYSLNSTLLLTNNYNQSTGTINIYPSSYNSLTNPNPIGGTTSGLTPWASLLMPSTAYYISCTLPSLAAPSTTFGSLNIISNGGSQNIFTNNVFTNNTSSPIGLGTYSSPVYATTYSGIFYIPSYQSIPIGTGITSLDIYNSDAIIILSGQSVATNTSYIIQGTVPSITFNSYQPILTNNGTVTNTTPSLNFYNTNNAFISPGPLSFSAGSIINTPSNASFATTYNADLNSNLTIPVLFPYQNLFTQNDADVLYTITNSTSDTIYINYFGTINLANSTPLNSAPSTDPYFGIAVAPSDTTFIINGALNISVTSTSGSTPITMASFANGTSCDYFVNDSGTALSLTTSPINFQLTNNYNQQTGDITFTGSSSPAVTGLQQWTSTEILTGSTAATFTQEFNGSSTTLTIPVSNSASSNIFENFILYNSYDLPINVTFYNGGIGSPLNTPTIVVQPGQFIPIIASPATWVSITSTGYSYTLAALGSTSTSYNVAAGSGVLTVTPYTPTLTNNNSQNQNITSISFYQSNGALISTTTGTFEPGDTINNIPATATFAQMPYLGVTLTIPLTLAPTSNLFTDYTLTNLADQTVGLLFSGPIINNNGSTSFNSNAISLAANQFTQIPSGATSVTLNIGGTNYQTQNFATPPTSSYFIYENTSTNPATWSFSPTILESSANLTNNSNLDATSLIFYNESGYELETGLAIPNNTVSNNAIAIPETATSTQFTQTINSQLTTFTIPVSDTASSNLFVTGGSINNASSGSYTTDMNIIFYTDNTYTTVINSPSISITAGSYCLIPSGPTTMSMTITSSTVTPTLNIQSDDFDTSKPWYVYYDSSLLLWVLSETIPATAYKLTNNYTTDADDIIFYDASNQITGYGITPLKPGDETSIYDTSTTAKLTFLGSTSLQIPISDTQSSSLITANVINNNAGQTIGIQYFGTINTVPGAFFNTSSNLIFDVINADSPILTNATSFTIYDSSGTAQVTQSITADTSYVINNDWTVTPVTGTFYLTNNSQSLDLNGSNLIFRDNTTTVGTGPNPFTNSTSTAITTGANNAQVAFNFNGSSTATTITIPVSYTTSSNVFATDTSNNLVLITNSSGSAQSLVFSGPVPGSIMNTTLSLANGQSVPILYGATALSVTGTAITSAPISPNANYYIYAENNSQSYLTNYPSNATTVNNYSTATPSNLQFFNATPANPFTIVPALTSFTTNQTIPMPTTTVYATVTESAPIASSWTIPLNNSAISQLFTSATIFNNSLSDNATLTFSGTVNGITNTPLNTSAIVVAPQASIQIPSGAGNTVSVYLAQNGTTYPLVAGTSYYLNEVQGTWSLNTYSSSAALFNNFNATITGLTFNNITNPVSQKVAYNGYAAMPTLSTTTTFTDFDVSFTLPVVATQTSNIFSTSVLTNTSSLPIGIMTFGTVGGTPDTQFNTVAAPTGAQILDTQEKVNIFTSATSLQIYNGSTLVIDTSTLSGLYPLPLNQSYNIVEEDGVWSLQIAGQTLMNNFNESTNLIEYLDADGNTISSISSITQPWATVAIPATAFSANINYDASNVTTILSTASSGNLTISRVFTNSLLINNSDTDVTVTYSNTTTTNGITTKLTLNQTPFLLQAGDSIPFVTGTNAVTLFSDGQEILNTSIKNSNFFWEIQNSVTSRGIEINSFNLLKAASPDLQQSSSALGILRFLGGSTPTPPNIKAVYLYAQNAALFKEYLYIDLYAQTIVNSTAQQAAKDAVNLIVDNYAISYRNQPDFNYISYFYLINDQLAAAQAILITQYPTSTTQINKYFTLLAKRITTLLV
jgi:hypothetical protein